ncbi:translation initiation factor 2 [uncultured Intestinimonas sp.]|uniref:translation initiation factor 2 n=1 Tax=uncultured Intestinimonas sp. TaxID=1689265 RepID=UPI0025F49806|nr:translation initiation factor 2 [uncultured Intestinimonas sp.]
MVKGVSKRVILVKEPDPKYFEEAIFVLREEAFGQGVSAEQVLREARQAAKSYLRGSTRPGKWFRQIPAPAYAAAGALAATAAWSLALFL